jgi:hypothetical protein
MAINYNNNNQGIGDLDLSQYGLIQPESTNMQVAGGYDTPTAGAYGFNLIELDRLKNAGYNPGEVSNWENKQDVQNLIRSLEPQASAVNEYGYPLTANLSGAVPNRVSAIDQMANYDWSNFDTNIAKNNALANQMNTTLDNTLMGSAKRDFTNVGGLGIANEPDVEQEEYLGNPTKFQNFKKGIMDNPLVRGAGTAFNFLRGSVPGMLMSGLGALFNRDGADYQQYTPDFDYKGLNDSMINDFYDPATGLNRFDRARKKGNTFGSARTGAEYFKLRREKKAANAAAEAKRQSDLRTVQQRAARGDSMSQIGKDMYTGSGQAFEKQKSGTFTTPGGKRGYSGGRRDGGRVGYADGGLATLFTRRG